MVDIRGRAGVGAEARLNAQKTKSGAGKIIISKRDVTLKLAYEGAEY